MKKATLLLILSFLGLGPWVLADSNPLALLPGMRPAAPAAPAPSPLPQEILSDLTNVPNPFDSRQAGLAGKTQISYRLSADFPVSVTLYDLLGVKVRGWTFRQGDNGARAGLNAFLWDGTNEAGRKVSKGGYLAQIEVVTPDGVATALRKIAVIH